jgi:quercetin 2,3-dioxygenase
MIERRPFNQLAAADHGWLKAKHHFSFGEFADPTRMGWGALRARRRNRPQHGLPAASSRRHGNHHLCPRGCHHAQRQPRPRGPYRGWRRTGDERWVRRHAEYNLEAGPTRIFQIWIKPTSRGGSPACGSQPFPNSDRSGRLVTLASGFDRDADALPIRADARVLGATLKAGESVEYALGTQRRGYLVPASGAGLWCRRGEWHKDRRARLRRNQGCCHH